MRGGGYTSPSNGLEEPEGEMGLGNPRTPGKLSESARTAGEVAAARGRPRQLHFTESSTGKIILRSETNECTI